MGEDFEDLTHLKASLICAMIKLSMPRIPAVCEQCNALFPSGFDLDGKMSATFEGNITTCPKCGGKGRVLDGIYTLVDGTIKLLSGPQYTVSQLERLAEVLKSAQERKASTTEVRREVEEELPELRTLTDILPRTRAELYAFITIILAIIQLLNNSDSSGTVTNINTDQVINYSIQNNYNSLSSEASSQTRNNSANIPTNIPHKAGTSKKIGRNEPCLCGSGKKYKYCHGSRQ